jgi:iron complex outermembrane receptor protein
MYPISLFRRLMAGSALVASCISLSVPAMAETALPEINVESSFIKMTPGLSLFLPQETFTPSGQDGGAFLTSVPGVSAARMGGHGLEPVIHGQQQTQLNVYNDGVITHGGCPNRMDPPSSFVSPETYDAVTVLRGYQSVRYGAGGTGGTILFERNPLSFEEKDFGYKAALGGGLESNGNIRSFYADLAAGNNLGQVRGVWSATSGDNYEDGLGTEVRSAFSSESYSLMPIWTPNADTTVKAGIELSRTDDVLYAGAGMDSPDGSALAYRLGFDRALHGEFLKKLSFNAYTSDVNHLMDNFTLRPNTGMKMKAPSKSDTFGGTISGDLDFSGVPLTMGVDLQNNDRDAWRYSGGAMATDATTPQSRLWPDVRIRQNGVFAEADPALSSTLKMRIGARYDRVEASASAADTVFGAVSPNTLYMNHYGVRASDHTENNFGGLLRFEYDVLSDTTLFAGISQSMRTADATERYIAANSAAAASRWVGNPNLDPERHRQFDLGASTSGEKWSAVVSGYYDDVQDFIMRDLARGQDGIVAASGEAIYRNIDATLIGLEAEGKYEFLPRWTLGGNAAWTYGNNDDDNDALAQIPPIEGRVSLEYAQGIWMVGTRFNFASRQFRIDNDTSQRDVGETGGYGTLDLYGKMDVKPFEVRLGVTNLLDKQYARHLNRSSAFDPSEVQVNEPGRSFGVQVHARF